MDGFFRLNLSSFSVCTGVFIYLVSFKTETYRAFGDYHCQYLERFDSQKYMELNVVKNQRVRKYARPHPTFKVSSDALSQSVLHVDQMLCIHFLCINSCLLKCYDVY